MTDALRRAIRTFVQAFLGSIATSGILSAAATEGVVDYSVLKKLAMSAAASGFVSLFSFLQNLLEDKGAIPAILKAPASDGVDPIPDPQVVDEVVEEVKERANRPLRAIRKATKRRKG
jgi:hypothetical protein